MCADKSDGRNGGNGRCEEQGRHELGNPEKAGNEDVGRNGPDPSPSSLPPSMPSTDGADRGRPSWVTPPDAFLDGYTSGALLGLIYLAAYRLRRDGWGAHGDIDGVREWVPYSDLWVASDHPWRHTDEQIQALAASIRRHGQLLPLIVTPCPDPTPWDKGGSGARLLIVDGVARWHAAASVPMLQGQVLVVPYRGPYATAVHSVAIATSQRALTPIERGMAVLRLYAAYKAERQERMSRQGREDLGQAGNGSMYGGLAPFPTPQELATLAGLSSRQARHWLRVARAGQPLVGLLRDGHLTPAQAIELAALGNAEERARRALEQTERNS